MALIRRKLDPQLVAPGDALVGRERRILDPYPRHAVFGLRLDEVPAGCEVAYLAMGCFWGAEKLYWSLDGVVNTAVGYAGGFTPNPTYKEVCTGQTGHTEAVQVVFDPSCLTYHAILQRFWENHDPTSGYRQGNDFGTQYRSAIFTTTAEQAAAATGSRDAFQPALTEQGYGSITTQIGPAEAFFYAEVEHQQYLIKNPNGYCPVHATGVRCQPAP